MKALAVSFNKRIAVELERKFPIRLDSKINRTRQQIDFVGAATPLTHPIMLEAVAGSGKSFTLLDFMQNAPGARWTIATMNSIGHRAWARKTGRRLAVSKDKNYSVVCDETLGIPSRLRGDILRLMAICKNAGILPKEFESSNRPLVENTPDLLEDAAFMYGTEFSDEIYACTMKALKLSITMAFAGKIDFDDQLYMSVCFKAPFEKYNIVVVDEAQDLSGIQHVMCEKLLLPNGVIYGAGDRNQAIYAFRGALSSSIPTMIQNFGMDPMPLTVSFRCPKAVVRSAKTEVPYIESAANAPEGDVIYHDELPLAKIPGCVICRNTAPLLSVALKLIGAGIGATVLGRDIGKTLERYVKKLFPEPVPITRFREELHLHTLAEIQKRPSREESLKDRESALIAVSYAAKDSDQVQRVLARLYAAESASVVLSTIHKAKGLEWDEVLFLDRHLIPSCYAEQDWQLQQESNLVYVGKTRAKKILHFVDSKKII